MNGRGRERDRDRKREKMQMLEKCKIPTTELQRKLCGHADITHKHPYCRKIRLCGKVLSHHQIVGLTQADKRVTVLSSQFFIMHFENAAVPFLAPLS